MTQILKIRAMARILFFVSLVSAAGLAMLSLGANAADSEPKTALGGSSRAIDEKVKPLTDSAPVEASDLVEDYSKRVKKEYEEGKIQEAIGRENEIRQTEMGLEEKSKAVILLGDNKSGRTLVMQQYILNNNQDTVYRLRMDKIYEMGDKAQQTQAIKNLIINLEKKALENTHGKTILYIDNAAALNQGAAVEVRPLDALTEAIAARRNLPMVIETDGPTNREVFMANKSVHSLISTTEVKSVNFDAVIYHLRRIKPEVQSRYGVAVSDASLAETARIATRYYANRPLDAAESLIKHAANRAAQELRENSTEAMRTKRLKAQIEVERSSIREDMKHDSSAELSERLTELDHKMAELDTKLSGLTVPDATIESNIADLKREIDDHRSELKSVEERAGWLRGSGEKKAIEEKISKKTATLRGLEKIASEIKATADKPSTLVNPRQVQIIASEFLKIPLNVFSINIDEAVKSIVDIKKTVINQDHIIDRAAVALSTYKKKRERDSAIAKRDGLEFKTKPIWSAMLAGSTGTGKTEITKQIAKQLGIPESDILRFDMTEYMERHSVSRMIGAPPGYVGFDEGGLLTNGVMEREYRVILFDEIEKAHPDLFNILMQVLDEGHLTDGQGRKVKFGNTIIVMTTNLGQDLTNLNRAQLLEFAKSRNNITKPAVELEKMNENELRLEGVKSMMRERWGDAQLARIDDIMVTNNHTRDAVEKITHNLFKKLARDYKEIDGVKIVISEAAIQFVEDAYTQSEGARGVKRTFEREIESQLNLRAGRGEFQAGNVVTVDYHDGKFDFVRTTAENYSKAALEGNPIGAERRARVKEAIKASQGAKALAEAPHANRMFDPDYMVRNATAKIMKRFRL